MDEEMEEMNEEVNQTPVVEDYYPPSRGGGDESFIVLASEADGNVPQEVLRAFYAYVGRDAATSVLTQDEIQMIRVGAEIMQDIDFMQLTPEEVDRMPWLLKANHQINDLAYLRLKKSINGTLLTNAIKSIVEHVSMQKGEGEQKGGFWSRLRGRL